MGIQKEKEIERAILHALNLRPDTLAIKYEGGGVYDVVLGARRRPGRFAPKGVADIIGVSAGRFFAIEVKSEAGRLGPEQVAFLSRVRRCAGRAGCARTVDEALAIVDGKEELFHGTKSKEDRGV